MSHEEKHQKWSKEASMSYLEMSPQERSKDGPGIMRKTQGYHAAPPEDPQEILLEARTYLQLFQQETNQAEAYDERLIEIQGKIERTGTYWQTYDELAYGARVAWRNNTRCIGRLHWKSLVVHDMRHLATAEAIFEAIVEHLWFATNWGKIRSTISIFAPATPVCP